MYHTQRANENHGIACNRGLHEASSGSPCANICCACMRNVIHAIHQLGCPLPVFSICSSTYALSGHGVAICAFTHHCSHVMCCVLYTTPGMRGPREQGLFVRKSTRLQACFRHPMGPKAVACSRTCLGGNKWKQQTIMTQMKKQHPIYLPLPLNPTTIYLQAHYCKWFKAFGRHIHTPDSLLPAVSLSGDQFCPYKNPMNKVWKTLQQLAYIPSALKQNATKILSQNG